MRVSAMNDYMKAFEALGEARRMTDREVEAFRQAMQQAINHAVVTHWAHHAPPVDCGDYTLRIVPWTGEA